MDVKQIEAKQVKKGTYVMIDDAACVVIDVRVSAPGKHGSAKCRIVAEGIADGKRREITLPGSAKIPSPTVDKRKAQILSIMGDMVQLMDLENYDVFELKVPEDLKNEVVEGAEAEYWVLAGRDKVLVNVRKSE
jgi:translation initiation factor 5A